MQKYRIQQEIKHQFIRKVGNLSHSCDSSVKRDDSSHKCCHPNDRDLQMKQFEIRTNNK